MGRSCGPGWRRSSSSTCRLAFEIEEDTGSQVLQGLLRVRVAVQFSRHCKALTSGARVRQAAAEAPFDMPAAPVQLIGAAGSVGGGGAAFGLGLFGSAHALAAGGLLRLQGVLFEDAKLTTVIFLCPRDPFVLDAPGAPAPGQVGGLRLFEVSIGFLQRSVEAQMQIDEECAIGGRAFRLGGGATPAGLIGPARRGLVAAGRWAQTGWARETTAGRWAQTGWRGRRQRVDGRRRVGRGRRQRVEQVGLRRRWRRLGSRAGRRGREIVGVWRAAGIACVRRWRFWAL